MESGRSLPKFQRDVLSSLSEFKSKASKIQSGLCLLTVGLA
jgi:hypothetical protein